jgi:thiosulfate/3-mercaptopyruvate sulfurtransferase
MDADALRQRVDDPDLIVVDCRHQLTDVSYGREAYAGGHIPGAFFLHVDDDLAGPKYGPDGRFRGRHPLPDRNALVRRLAAIGMKPETTLVAYDDGDSMYAARLWWLMLWLGHSRVAVLDGGLKGWCGRGYPLSTDVPQCSRPAVFEARAPLVGTIDANTLMSTLGSGRYLVLDARGADRYRGDIEPMDSKAGHIPGARNRPFRQNLTDGDRFKPSAELRDDFAAIIADMPMERVVHQCGSGVSACHNILAMAVAGIDGTLLYPGSWSEWSSDPQRPVAIGDAP